MTAATVNLALDKKPWLRRLGTWGFMFFLVKGLLWLAAPFLFYQVL